MSGFGEDMAATGGNMLYDQLTMAQQYNNQAGLMDLQQQNNLEIQNQQFANQQALNKQGHNLQFEMWNKTNFGAQMEHLKKAGLNPALMYGKGGSGGVTGSQGGGSAAGGSAGLGMAPQSRGEISMYGSQKELMNAQANKLNADADATRGYNKDESESRSSLNNAKELAEYAGIGLTNKEVENVGKNTELLDAQLKTNYDVDQGIGTNYYKNIMDFVSGKYNISTYIGAASAALTIMPIARGTMLIGKMASKNKAVRKAAVETVEKLGKTSGIGAATWGISTGVKKATNSYNEGKTKTYKLENISMQPEEESFNDSYKKENFRKRKNSVWGPKRP